MEFSPTRHVKKARKGYCCVREIKEVGKNDSNYTNKIT